MYGPVSDLSVLKGDTRQPTIGRIVWLWALADSNLSDVSGGKLKKLQPNAALIISVNTDNSNRISVMYFLQQGDVGVLTNVPYSPTPAHANWSWPTDVND